MILSTFETIDWANKEDTKISFQWHFKKQEHRQAK